MRSRILCVCAMGVLAVAAASAQTKTTMSGKCEKPSVQQSVPAGDHQGHMFMIAQGKCSVTGSVDGMAGKEGNYSEHLDATPTNYKNWGVYTVTFDNGDKIYYTYQGMANVKDGMYQSGTNKYQISGGTGKMKGLKGSGSCKLTGNGGGTLNYSCTGE